MRPRPDSAQSWLRLAATMLVSTIGGVGMWSVVVALPVVQTEFGVPRAEASLPFTLAMMMAFGVVGRAGSGLIVDRVGGLPTLMLGSALQAVALLLYLLYDGLVSLYVISAVFGLFQGGIIPSYAIIVREYFPAREAGVRVGIILMASLIGSSAARLQGISSM